MRLYEIVTNYGLAVILFALLVKVVLLPFQMKSKRSMMNNSRLQPKIKELEKKHGANKQKYNEEVSKLYKEEKINPMSGCLWSLIPFPIIIALFSAIRQPINIMMGIAKDVLNDKIVPLVTESGWVNTLKPAYEQISQAQYISDNPDVFSQVAQITDKIRYIDYSFLGIDLGRQPEFSFLWSADWTAPDAWKSVLLFLIPIVSGIVAFFSSRISMKMNAMPDANQQSTTKTMMLLMPVISVWFAFSMPAAIGIYIIFSTLFSMIQDIILTSHYKKVMAIEDAERTRVQQEKEAELEAKRLETERKKLENATTVNKNTSKKKQQKLERLEQQEKAVEWEKKNAPEPSEKPEEDSRVGTRKFARGRAYDPERFGGDDSGEAAPSESEQDEDADAETAAAIDTDADAAPDNDEENGGKDE